MTDAPNDHPFLVAARRYASVFAEYHRRTEYYPLSHRTRFAGMSADEVGTELDASLRALYEIAAGIIEAREA